MEFGTWYQINCETEREWPDDFARIRDSGFDFTVLWNVSPATGDLREIVYQSEKTRRALAEIQRAGLVAYLGIWNPSVMGKVPLAYRPRGINGETLNRPNIFNREWLDKEWKLYIKTVAKLFAPHEAYRGLYFDDSFSVRENTTPYWSYAASDKKRFRQWLESRYLSIKNLNMKYRRDKPYRSFAVVKTPHSPEESLVLWNDWMEARSAWGEDFARVTRDAYRSVDANPQHQLVLSDYDYYLDRSSLHHGVNYKRLMSYFDRFEIYMADDHRKVERQAILANTRHNVKRGCEIAGSKPFQFHTWFTDPFAFKPMKPELLEDIIDCAVENGAGVIEIYTFKVHDFRIPPGSIKLTEAIPPFKEVSLKYNPIMLKRVRKLIAKLKYRASPKCRP